VRERRGRKRLGIGRGKRRVARAVNGKEEMEKKEGGLDLDICPGAPKFLLKPLYRCLIFKFHRQI